MRALVLPVVLAVIASGCGLVEPEPTSAGSVDGRGSAASPFGTVDGGHLTTGEGDSGAGASATSLPGSSFPGTATSTPLPGSGNQNVIIATTDVDEDGAIAADGTNVYWIQLGDDGVNALMSCPVTGCQGGTPREVWAAVNAGSVPGELLVANGLVYFQTTDQTLVECPASGCGDAPTVFANITATDNASASLTTDGQYLYWEDQQRLYSCPLGATCESPTFVAKLRSGTVVAQLSVSGPNIYWVDRSTGHVETAALVAGATTTLCTVPLLDAGVIGEGSFAILDGYAYVSTGVQASSSAGGIYRCPLQGGTATLYSSGSSVISVGTDGASLFWLAGNTTASTTLYVCLPGDACGSPATFVGPEHHMEGFTLYGDHVYTVAPQIQQTTETYP